MAETTNQWGGRMGLGAALKNTIPSKEQTQKTSGNTINQWGGRAGLSAATGRISSGTSSVPSDYQGVVRGQGSAGVASQYVDTQERTKLLLDTLSVDQTGKITSSSGYRDGWNTSTLPTYNIPGFEDNTTTAETPAGSETKTATTRK